MKRTLTILLLVSLVVAGGFGVHSMHKPSAYVFTPQKDVVTTPETVSTPVEQPTTTVTPTDTSDSTPVDTPAPATGPVQADTTPVYQVTPQVSHKLTGSSTTPITYSTP